MNSRHLSPTYHLSNDELLSSLYGIGEPALDRHVRECPECAIRYAAFEQRRAQMRDCEASTEFLSAQRRAIYARLGESPDRPMRWGAPAVTVFFLLVASWFVYGPGHSPGPSASPHSEITDEQLFSDVYSLEQSAEPRAATPIHELFEQAVYEASEEQ